MGRVHRVIAALMLMVFIPVAVLAGPLRLCVSQAGHQAIELAHLPHAGDDGEASLVAEGAVDGFHDQLPSCVDRPLIVVQSTSSVAKIDSKLSKSDGTSGGAFLAGHADAAASLLPRVRPRLRHAVQLASDPQLAALRTVVLLI